MQNLLHVGFMYFTKRMSRSVMHQSELCNLYIESCNSLGISFITFGNMIKRRLLYKILIGIAAGMLLLFLLKVFVLEPWVKYKIHSSINKSTGAYLVKIGNVHISVFRSAVELKNISIQSKPEQTVDPAITGEIESLSLVKIRLIKALFKKDIDIGEVTFFNSNFAGKISFPEESGQAATSPVNIRVDNLIFDQINLDIASDSTAQSYALTEGVLKIYGLQVEKLDSLTPAIIGSLEFEAREFITVSPDSMYTISVTDINYSATSNILAAGIFSINPNYTYYEFTSRHHFETDRIEGLFSRVSVHGFSAVNYITSGDLISSFIEIGEMDMDVFRDKRKEFRHVNKPSLQELIYDYPGNIHIDSIAVLGGGITYREHAQEANDHGMISFNNLNALICTISNDTIYKTKEEFLEIKAEALLMDTARITLLFKGRIFDSQSTYSLQGSLSGMEVPALNPILENNAFIFVESGKIDEMNFSLTANNTKATGSMNLLYHDLKIKVINKQTDETSGLKEQLISFIANMVVINENPKPGKEVRVGIIDFERDPEKFIFNYWVKSLLSGIKSSLT